MSVTEISQELKAAQNINEIIGWLKSIGKIDANENLEVIEDLVRHDDETIRAMAIKTLGKAANFKYLTLFFLEYKKEKSTKVRRECTSAIGRLRNKLCISTLIEILKDDDPKVVSQAIRGLLVFKGTPNVDNVLKALVSHQNEMVQQVIKKEYFENPVQTISKYHHTETPNYLHNVVVNADTINVMKLLNEDTIHLTFTSPPYYNARDYSIYQSYKEYLDFLDNVFREVMRITKEGRFLIVNTSPVIVPRISRAHSSKRYPIPFDLHTRLMNQGWEFIDDIIWMKPEYSVKNRVGGFQQHRKPLGYKPNCITEYLMVYRKPTAKLLDWNIHQYPLETISCSKVSGNFESTNVWQICPKSDKVHSAVFPEELCKRVIEYYSYKRDLVFDPFGGSGTFGRVATKMDRFFLMTEKDKDYFEYMQTLFVTSSYDNQEAPQFLTIDQFKSIVQ
jgi:DNA modification methylase